MKLWKEANNFTTREGKCHFNIQFAYKASFSSTDRNGETCNINSEKGVNTC